MIFSMTGELVAIDSSGAQQTAGVMEAWAEQNLFCPNCSPPNLSRLRGTRAVPLWLLARK
jgi:hypothetical protein